MSRISLLFTLFVLALPASATAALSTTHSGWLWGSPEPQGNDLLAVEVQGGAGYAAGDFGTLLHTTDSGGSWSTVRTGLFTRLSRLDVIDSDSLVVGSECALRRTDDGGATFRRLPFTTSERRCPRQVAAVAFPSAIVGYLLLTDGAVLKTADGGRSFSALTNAPRDAGAITALAFADAQAGLVTTAGGDVYRTVDGGASWTREYDGAVRLAGVFASGTTAVAVGEDATFLISTDRGDSWTRPAAAPEAPPPPAAGFTAVRCVPTGVTCLMSTIGPFFRTSDGGRSFEQVELAATAVDFASPSRAVAVGAGGRIAISDDAGATFAALDSRLAATPAIGRIRATSPSVAHALGFFGALARTEDGGETWVNVGVPTGGDVRDVSFPQASLGYALDSGGGVFRTENGGQSWSVLDAEAAEPPLAIHSPDGSIVLLIGPRGMLRSTDGGETFAPHRDRVVRVRTLTDVDRAGGAIVAFGPRVIALSTNAGASWRRIVRPTQGAEVQHVDFVSPRAGYVLETDGRLYATRDRGRTWTEVIGTGHTDGRQLAFGDARSGWLTLGAETNAVALRTSDGGRSWRPQIIGPGRGMFIASPAPRTGFAAFGVFSDAKLVFTHSGGDAGTPTALTLATRRRIPERRTVTVRGRLQPATGGEQVAVRARPLNGRRWRQLDATVSPEGTFSVRHRVRSATVFVAQWAGDQDSAGDGSAPLVVRIDRGRG
jgi:photosystem II stability/assembly factor-like uncharacterized protein